MTADVSRSCARRLAAEAVGTAMLLAAVVGSGIMGERLSGGNVAIALLANTLATGAALVALILTFGPISGAHFNPAVSLADASQGGLSWRDATMYAIAPGPRGAWSASRLPTAMFAEPVFAWSHHARGRTPTGVERGVATFGLARVIWGCARDDRPGGPLRRRRVHHRRVLVHGVYFIRESRRDGRSRNNRHIRRNSTE